MQNEVTRRSFMGAGLKTSACFLGFQTLAGSTLLGIEPFQRKGRPRFLLSLAAYSFRNFFVHGNNRKASETKPARPIDLTDFIDFCADHGCYGTELTSYYFPPDVTEEYLLKLKRHAFLRGIEISGTAVGNTFTLPPGEKRSQQIASVKTWIDHAFVMGAPHIRIFAGNLEGASKEEAKRRCIAAMEECCEYAGRKGILLGLENHGGIVAEAADLLDLLKAVQSPWLGVNLDSGNFHTDDPYGDIAQCAPYAVNVQIKVELRRRGQVNEPSDLPRLVRILRDANYQGYVVLEYEAAEDPWKAVPRYLEQLGELLA